MNKNEEKRRRKTRIEIEYERIVRVYLEQFEHTWWCSSECMCMYDVCVCLRSERASVCLYFGAQKHTRLIINKVFKIDEELNKWLCFVMSELCAV